MLIGFLTQKQFTVIISQLVILYEIGVLREIIDNIKSTYSYQQIIEGTTYTKDIYVSRIYVYTIKKITPRNPFSGC